MFWQPDTNISAVRYYSELFLLSILCRAGLVSMMRCPTTNSNQSELLQLESGTRQMCDFTFNLTTNLKCKLTFFSLVVFSL